MNPIDNERDHDLEDLTPEDRLVGFLQGLAGAIAIWAVVGAVCVMLGVL